MARPKKYARGRRPGKKSVDMETFLTTVAKVAAAGGTQSEVADKLGLTAGAVSLRCKALRDRGVKVPKFTKTGTDGRRIDVAACNAILAAVTAG